MKIFDSSVIDLLLCKSFDVEYAGVRRDLESSWFHTLLLFRELERITLKEERKHPLKGQNEFCPVRELICLKDQIAMFATLKIRYRGFERNVRAPLVSVSGF